MCGLCGNFDGNEENDLRDAEGNEINCTERVTQNGRKKCAYPQLGNSWEVPDYDSLPGYGSYFNGLFTFTETDSGTDSDSDSEPDGYTVLFRICTHDTDSDLDPYSLFLYTTGIRVQVYTGIRLRQCK